MLVELAGAVENTMLVPEVEYSVFSWYTPSMYTDVKFSKELLDARENEVVDPSPEKVSTLETIVPKEGIPK